MNLPTLISLSRGFLCLFFLSDSVGLRTLAIVLAALTDFLDGYLARRLQQTTPLATRLDPLMDKLFVGAALAVLWWEERLVLWQVAIFLLRDISLLFFALYLVLANRYHTWHIRSFLTGKLMTSLQFVALVLLAQVQPVPAFLWTLLVLCGTTCFFELVWLSRRPRKV